MSKHGNERGRQACKIRISSSSDTADDQKTVVRASKIANAGYGLFAGEAIKKGRVIDGMSSLPRQLTRLNSRICGRGAG